MEGTCGVCGIASVTLLRLTLSDAAGETDRVDLCAGCASRAYIAVDVSNRDRVEFGLAVPALETNEDSSLVEMWSRSEEANNAL
jgi:hypothetical protein